MPVTLTTPDELLDAARSGDAAARELLVETHLDTVRAVCGSRLASPHDVADAVQETFLRALPRLDQVRDAAALGGWLRAIAVRICVDHGRSAGRTVCVPDAGADDVAPGASPQELAVAADEARRLRRHLAGMNDRDRRALWLRDAIGLPVTDVARDLGVTEGSARVLLHRARSRLRAAYQGLTGLLLGGLGRLRQRMAVLGDTVPVDLHAAVAAQIAMAIAITLVPSSAPGSVPSVGVDAVAATTPPATGRVGTGERTPTHGAGSTPPSAPVPQGTAPGATAAPSSPDPAPLVVAGDEEPDAPRGVEVSASDSDGELTEVIVYGGTLLGPDDDGDGEADADDADGDPHDDPDDGEEVGPVVVTHPDVETAVVVDSLLPGSGR